MVSPIRKAFNKNFRNEDYELMLKELDMLYPGAIEFRLAETPVFVPRHFRDAMLSACDSIIDFILSPDFMHLTEGSVPPADKVAGDPGLPQMIAFDFGVCQLPGTPPEPQLVEMQGFPSLYGFQDLYPNLLRDHFVVPENFSQYLNGHNHTTYKSLLHEVILGGHAAENVVLLEIRPHQQKTRIDFYYTSSVTGIEPVCITELLADGDQLYYLKNGKRTRIKRIYNRVIFDELHQVLRPDEYIDLRRPYAVEWLTHPDWFYRISKYTLPFIDHPNVPETFFLSEVKQLPGDLSQFVLKPLFSFAGQGVVIDVTPSDIEKIADPQNWILQRKVPYADIIETPTGPAKTEIRIMYLWRPGAARPEPVINLARLSKGKMIGTRYNKDKTWVGGSVAFFENG